MKNTLKIKYVKQGLFLFALVSLIALENCAPIEVDIVDDDPPASTVTGRATDKVEHKHKKGTDPCPQDISSPCVARCYPSSSSTKACDADSVSIKNSSSGYSCTFGNGASGIGFDDANKERKINMKFTCAIAKSFKDSFELEFFSNQVSVGTEVVEMDVIVD